MRINEMPAVIHDWPEHTRLTEGDSGETLYESSRVPTFPGYERRTRPQSPDCPRRGRPVSSHTRPLTTTTRRL